MSQAPALLFDRTHLTAGSRICVAVSGGADSVALLTALHAANALPRAALGVGLAAVHVHHGLRGEEADEDARFVVELCERLAVPLRVRHVDVAGRVAGSGETMEEAARTLRYDVFRSLLAAEEADAVATAHTLDDQAETVLMKLLRGAWTEGLSGIYPVVHPAGAAGGRIVRPLLGTRRAAVEGYLGACSQTWREDTSNADPGHTRNRLRHRVLPLLREENPSIDQTLANLAVLAREEELRWAGELSRMLPQLLLPGKPVRGGGRAVATSGEGGTVALEIDRIRSLDAAARRRVLRAAARSLGKADGGPQLSFSETERVLALCGFGQDRTVAARAGGVLELAHGLRAERTARELRLSWHGGGGSSTRTKRATDSSSKCAAAV